jgi:acyl-CoA reductase-like NAD-dependent aldehyde dehydrogenase
MAEQVAFFLAGRRAAGTSETVLLNPYDGAVLAHVRQAGAEHIEQAITGMVAAFEIVRRWSSHQRRRACAIVYRGLEQRRDEFARCIAKEAGKPIKTAESEVARALTTFRVAVEESTRIVGEQLPVDIDERSHGYHAVVERVPIGPCVFITPFNFPLNLVAHKVAPALAVGCPFIVKPSERTPLTALLLGELLADAGYPEGFWSILPCDRTVAQALVTDDRVKLLSFTGSPDVGWSLKAQAGKKSVILELGNNSAVIVEPETDLSDAIPRIVNGAFSYAGQSCISVQRIFLHQDIAAAATAALVAQTKALRVGNPLSPDTDVGPMIDEAAAVRLESWINAAVSAGARVLVGHLRRGNLYEPTLLCDVPHHTDLARKEAFGPVAIIEVYRDFAAVLERVNATPFGLQAGIFTRDLFKARAAFERLEVGGVVINDVPTLRIDAMPYGGVKDSGIGREGVKYAIEHFTERKVLVTRYPPV